MVGDILKFSNCYRSQLKLKTFCLFLCSNEPHGPYTKGDPALYRNAKLTPQQIEIHRESYAKYLAEITYFDRQVGEVLRMVEQQSRSNVLFCCY